MTKLASRALGATLWFHLALAVLIFLPAWSLAYWQGWLFVAVLAAGSLATTLYFLRHDPGLVERRLKAGPAAETRPTQKLIQAAASVGICSVVILSALDHHFGWSTLPWPVVLAGDALILLGYAAVFRVFLENSFAAATIGMSANQTVVTTSPYAFVRHPMYAGAIPMFLGIPLALGSWWGLLPAAGTLCAIVWRLLDEEQYLERNLPGYDDYRRKVRWRLVPGLW